MRSIFLILALAACTGGSDRSAVDSRKIDAAAVEVVVQVAKPPAVIDLLKDFEAERDAEHRVELARLIAHEDAVAAGAEDRVIALVRSYQAIANGDGMISQLLMSLVRGQPLPVAVGDLVLELAGAGGRSTRFVAFFGATRMSDRLPDVCARMAELAPTGDLARVIDVVARAAGACDAHLDPILDAIAAAAKRDLLTMEHYFALDLLLDRTTLTEDQLERLERAARVARKADDRYAAEQARLLYDRVRRMQ